MWAAGLNATGDAINPDKCNWTLADYRWMNGWWSYAKQPDLGIIKIPLPDGSTTNILQGEVLVAEKALGIWSSINGKQDAAYIKHNVME